MSAALAFVPRVMTAADVVAMRVRSAGGKSRSLETCLVGDDAASEWLRETPHARSTNYSRIASYVDDIKTGRWVANGETIKIGSDGHLLNGHHRLLAIVQARVPVVIDFILSIDPSTKESIDTGLPKRTHDWSPRANATAGYVVCRSLVQLLTSNNSFRPSAGLLNDVWDLIGDRSMQFAIQKTNGSRIARAGAARLAIACVHRIDEGRATIMAERLETNSAPAGSTEASYIKLRVNRPSISGREHAPLAARMAVAALRSESRTILRPLSTAQYVKELQLEPIHSILPFASKDGAK